MALDSRKHRNQYTQLPAYQLRLVAANMKHQLPEDVCFCDGAKINKNSPSKVSYLLAVWLSLPSDCKISLSVAVIASLLLHIQSKKYVSIPNVPKQKLHEAKNVKRQSCSADHDIQS